MEWGEGFQGNYKTVEKEQNNEKRETTIVKRTVQK
jgi:hypothetical protein